MIKIHNIGHVKDIHFNSYKNISFLFINIKLVKRAGLGQKKKVYTPVIFFLQFM